MKELAKLDIGINHEGVDMTFTALYQRVWFLWKRVDIEPGSMRFAVRIDKVRASRIGVEGVLKTLWVDRRHVNPQFGDIKLDSNIHLIGGVIYEKTCLPNEISCENAKNLGILKVLVNSGLDPLSNIPPVDQAILNDDNWVVYEENGVFQVKCVIDGVTTINFGLTRDSNPLEHIQIVIKGFVEDIVASQRTRADKLFNGQISIEHTPAFKHSF